MDEVYDWHMIKHGLNNEPFEVTYAASLILTDDISDGINSTNIVKRKGNSAVLFVSRVIMENLIKE